VSEVIDIAGIKQDMARKSWDPKEQRSYLYSKVNLFSRNRLQQHMDLHK
jgi:hypothetical protein